MCTFLRAVRAANGDMIVLMILDNGPIYHTKLSTALAEELDIVFLFLPPYSPQFNPIELIWKTIKARISGMFLLYKEHLVDTIGEFFIIEASKSSYADSWRKTFFDDS